MVVDGFSFNGINNVLSFESITVPDAGFTVAKIAGLQDILDDKYSINGLAATMNTKQNTLSATNRLNAAFIGGGNVSTTEFDYLDGVTSGIQGQIDLKAPLAGPTFTGDVEAPTTATTDNSTKVATTAFVQSRIAEVIDSAPAALDTLNELAAALGDDADYANTITTALSGKQSVIQAGDLSISATNGLQTALDSKQPNIADGDLTIAKTAG